MGGKEAARPRPWPPRGAPRGWTRTLSGISSSSSSSSSSSYESDAGSLVDAAVEGFRSWRGEGARCARGARAGAGRPGRVGAARAPGERCGRRGAIDDVGRGRTPARNGRGGVPQSPRGPRGFHLGGCRETAARARARARARGSMRRARGALAGKTPSPPLARWVDSEWPARHATGPRGRGRDCRPIGPIRFDVRSLPPAPSCSVPRRAGIVCLDSARGVAHPRQAPSPTRTPPGSISNKLSNSAPAPCCPPHRRPLSMTNLARPVDAADAGSGARSSPSQTMHGPHDRLGRTTPGGLGRVGDGDEDNGAVKIYAGKLFDPYTLQLLPQRVVTVSPASGLVVDVREWTAEELQKVNFADEEGVVDLRGLTVLPGFVDAHVHSESSVRCGRCGRCDRGPPRRPQMRGCASARPTALRRAQTTPSVAMGRSDVRLLQCSSTPTPRPPGRTS